MLQIPELLSPAGDLERLRYAINYSADAVYCSLPEFGMRSAPANFTPEQLTEGVIYAHARGRKVYLTMNTLPTNEEADRLPQAIKDAAAAHAKLKTIHDTFIKKNFKLTKDAYAAQHKEELDTFNKAVRTLMKLNGSTAVDFSALDAEFSALQSGSAELRNQLETLPPDISDLKSVRKYIDMVLNKQQLFAPGGKTPEKESVLKKLNDSKAALEQKKSQTQPKESEHTL